MDTTSLNRLNRLFLYIGVSSGVFVVLVAILMLSSVSRQMKRDAEFRAKLNPSINFVYTFRGTKHRLPTAQEFAARPSAKTDWMIELITKDASDPAFKSEGGRTTSDFCVRIWRGESWTYYYSWKKSFDVTDA